MIDDKSEATIAERSSICILAAGSVFVIGILWYGYCAANLPGYFGIDGYINNEATRYIAKHRKIPELRADDPEIVFTSLGTTRLSRPPFSFIVSAIFYGVGSKTMIDENLRLRLGSVILGGLTLVFAFIGLIMASQHLGLALAGTILFGGLPRFTFLASTNNDDIGGIFAATILFTSLIWLYRGQFRVAKVYLLAIAVGITLMAKFTAWLLLPWAFLLSAPIFWAQRQKLLRHLPILCLVTILFGAWWPISNMVQYGWGDPTALQQAEVIQLQREGGQPNARGYWSQDVNAFELLRNHDEFLSSSLKSAVGYLPLVGLEMHSGLYWLYGVIGVFAFAVACSALRDPFALENRLRVIAFCIVLTEVVFYVHHNLQRDIQLDARYVLPALMPITYLFISTIVPSRWATVSSIGKHRSIKPLTIFSILIFGIFIMVNNWFSFVINYM